LKDRYNLNRKIACTEKGQAMDKAQVKKLLSVQFYYKDEQILTEVRMI
jgi:hypothetical protein